MLAAVRIRGTANVSKDIRSGLESLKLMKPNHCIVMPDNAYSVGMLTKVKDYVTWGLVSDEVLKKMIKARGEGVSEKEVTKHVFRLSPPRKGFERKSKNKSFVQGGPLGNRKEKINDLLERMI